MLDIKFIRDNIDRVREGAKNKRLSIDLDRLLELDQSMRPMQIEWENLQAQRNSLSKEIGQASPEARSALKAQVTQIKGRMDDLEQGLKTLRKEFADLMLLVPQPARSDVPIGRDDQDNVEVRREGTVPQFDFPFKDHVAIGESRDFFDIERGVKLAGSRSYVLKGMGARLEQAILRLTYDLLVERGYTPMSIPVLVTEDCMVGTGYFPTGREQAYLAERDQMALVGTAEVALTSYHAKEILKADQLPIRMMALSSCFRREAGTYGKDTQGLYRVHQFQKIEQVIIGPADPQVSETLHTELLTNAEDVLRALELPYRVVYVCTGDLGQGQVRKHDIETWMPSRKSYSETHSCSTFHDFQARRLQMRYKTPGGENLFCYTLNNTAIASPRVLIPFLECHQQASGKIRIPQKLQPYLGGLKEI
jgi:seryl-tRNA synthetase